MRPQNQRNHTSRGTQGNCPLWKPTRRSTALTSAACESAGPPPRRLVKAEAHALQTHRRVGWLLADPVLHARASARSGWPGGYCRLHGSPRPYYRACCGADSLAGGTPANSQARGPAHVLQLRQQGRRRGRRQRAGPAPRSAGPGRLGKPASSTAATRSKIPAIWYAMHYPHGVRILCGSNPHKRVPYCQRYVKRLTNVTTFDVRQAAPGGVG